MVEQPTDGSGDTSRVMTITTMVITLSISHENLFTRGEVHDA